MSHDLDSKIIAERVLKKKYFVIDKKDLVFDHEIPQNFLRETDSSEDPYLIAGGYILRSIANQNSPDNCVYSLDILSYALASQKLRDESFLYRTLLYSHVEGGSITSSLLIKVLKKEYLNLEHRFMKRLEDYLEDIKITMRWKEREKLIYEHKKKEHLQGIGYKGYKVLVKSEFIADMGFSGYSKNPLGIVKGKPKQKDEKTGKLVTRLEKLSNEEQEELRKRLNKYGE